jgi:hypothetical protein
VSSHYSLKAFQRTSHSIPIKPGAWAAYALQHKNPANVTGWSMWSAWQFAGGFDSVGLQYGMQSRDLDVNILKDAEYSRFIL